MANSAKFKIPDGKATGRGYLVRVQVPNIGPIWFTTDQKDKRVACMRARQQAGDLHNRYMQYCSFSDEEIKLFNRIRTTRD